jgi:amidophosphoribosyltransferase
MNPGRPDADDTSRLVPRMLLDIQNRGQLSAGMTTFNPDRRRLLQTHRDLGSVSEVFHLTRRKKSGRNILTTNRGRAAIGHVRYATCGPDDVSYAQPFERVHIQRHKWFAFAFNGQLANYDKLRDEVLSDPSYYLSRDTDTEIILHEICRLFSGENRPSYKEMCQHFARRFDGAWSIAYLNALGHLVLARDPLGIRPLCYAFEDGLFAAASESVALLNLGYQPEQIHSLEPGCLLTVDAENGLRVERYDENYRRAHCFFEWIYFANVASSMDDRSVYLTRKALGEELAQVERDSGIDFDERDTIVVPVPDTSKAAADAMAHALGLPSIEGLIRNRYAGRTFIEGSAHREAKARLKYTPLREVLEGKRVLLVEDSIVRSTTMRVLLDRLRQEGRPKELHVRIACPPILAPCFYGIDMSSVRELFAPRFAPDGLLTEEAQQEMARQLGADSLRYLPVDSIARALAKPSSDLCEACITGRYPTPEGQRLYHLDIEKECSATAVR